MSLINKMLQDLERRNDTVSKSEPLSGEVHAVSMASSPRASKLPGLLVLGVVVLVGAWFFVQSRTSQAPVVVAVAPPAPAPAVAAAPTPIAAPAPMPEVVTPEATVAVARAAVVPTSKPPAKPVAEPTVKPAAVQVAVAEPKAANMVTAQGITKKASRVVPEEDAPAPEKTAPVTVPAIESKSQKQFNPQQQSDNLYKQAIAQVQQGQNSAARQSLRQALQANQHNVNARQMLAGLLIEGNTPDEASALLREGLKLSPTEGGFSMALARLQLENGDTNGSMTTLEQGLPSAGDEPQYHAFYAVLLQRAKRHEEAVKHYLVALRSDPGMPTWLVGIGISLQAQGKDADATEAFRRARDGGMLNPQLAQFVEQRLSQLK
jgi:MSHA biogenesis protein MshN